MAGGEQLGMFISGEWCGASTGETFPAVNPATGEPLALIAQGTRDDATRAVAAARRAWNDFRTWTAWERADLCRRVSEVLTARRDELALVISKDQGKPLHTEAYAEVDLAIAGFAEAAELVKHREGASIPLEDRNKRALTVWQPRGVYGVVTPWNFPVNIPTEYLAPGLAAGNAIVWVPAPSTSVCAVRLMECLEQAGVPAGVVNLVTGPGPVVGAEVVAHPDVDAIGFTGSTATGHEVARQAAGKPQLLELGGNGPTIVLADADLEAAADAITAGCTLTAGQTCAATELILAERQIVDELAELVATRMAAVTVGDPLDPDTSMGPLNNEAVAAKMDRHVADAVDRGARLLCGGKRLPELGSSLYFGPTVLRDVPVAASTVTEETFGPIAPIVTVESQRQALDIAAASPLGLSASVWTTSMGAAMRAAEELRCGIVNINEASSYWEIHVPFGGGSGKRSGVGRLGGRHTLAAMSTLKTVTFDISRF